ncbi:MAG: hypothetical protein JWP30_130, partial [Homoserinimonas sp.]|nr:hypothetical protein [Homoserinimonas sp.]
REQGAGSREQVIIAAVKPKRLIARRIDGDKAIILRTDIQAWRESLPTFGINPSVDFGSQPQRC